MQNTTEDADIVATTVRLPMRVASCCTGCRCVGIITGWRRARLSGSRCGGLWRKLLKMEAIRVDRLWLLLYT